MEALCLARTALLWHGAALAGGTPGLGPRNPFLLLVLSPHPVSASQIQCSRSPVCLQDPALGAAEAQGTLHPAGLPSLLCG